MKMNRLIQKRFESVFEEYGIEHVENVLESGTWRCIGSSTNFENYTNSKSYEVEMLLDRDAYDSFFENELDENAILYKMKTILNVLSVDATEVEKNRVKITFKTQYFFIEGRC